MLIFNAYWLLLVFAGARLLLVRRLDQRYE